ncbi:hypothetical protein HDV00_010419 [Rhizophlyctis rosea]|nr:hypothetical protein HDV00_010419 [Rhizophlyctis rosea]
MLSKAPTGRAAPPPPQTSKRGNTTNISPNTTKTTSSTHPRTTGRPAAAAAAEKSTGSGKAVKSGASKDGAANQSERTKLSMKFNTPVVDPMGKGVHKTSFSAVYSKGGIPCRLNHGSVKHKIAWTRDPSELDYNPLLPTMIDGLRETQHPYTFVVRQGLKELLDAPGAAQKAAAVGPALVAPLRAALSIKEKEAFLVSLDIFVSLINLLGPAMTPYLGTLIPPIGTRVLSSDCREQVYEALRAVDLACGEDAMKIVRTKVPTYTSVYL